MKQTQPRLQEPPPHVDQYARDVIGAAIDVHRYLGPGFPERIYRRAMLIELRARAINVETELCIPIEYKQQSVGEMRLDFLVEQELIVELKAIDAVHPIHRAQVLSYLKASNLKLGLIINFNARLLRDGIQRVVLTPRGHVPELDVVDELALHTSRRDT